LDTSKLHWSVTSGDSEVAARSNPNLRILDDDTLNYEMVAKLPEWLSSRWVREVHKSRERFNCFPPFAEFVNFLKHEADIACEPLIRSQQKSESSVSKSGNSSAPGTARSLNTVAEKDACLYCEKKNHTLEQCFKLRSKTFDEKKAFIMQKGLCFGCLASGHVSKHCKKRLSCSVCSKRHPSVMHNEETKDAASAVSNRDTKDTPSKSERLAGQRKSDSTEPDQQSKTSLPTKHVSMLTHDSFTCKSTMVLPVYLSHNSCPDREVLVYALLDTQSDTSFVSEQTAADLGVNGVDTTLVLSTLTSENALVKSVRISGLTVRGHSSQIVVHLPPVYTKECIPACRDNIPTPEMASTWPYLEPVASQLMPKTDCDIGLLIGYNCPKALVPRDVIPPFGDGPFAQKTDLGWAIVGLTGTNESAGEESHANHHICSKETGSHIVLRTSCKEVFTPSYILQFFGREEDHFGSGGQSFSQDDLQFMSIMQRDIKQMEDGHYELPLPLRNPDQPLVNNRAMALQRLQALVKRFKRDPEHYVHYKKFMQDLFKKGYAERVPEEELGLVTRALYLPHHGVYNPNKPGKVRVVMDGSA